ncbi:hypothetical protein TVAG_169910 [Trichomonas vaginalis G3]|uniref:Uncharacterized protein n=1 Tax=Trichomonas vaginalis (strain ATCC PRA-98 / G3) TaxID=412133 RepID=A2DPD5_TRIV3|nr:hypothetical protein TVAGG3_0681050 [Trichomonas vaginalis G3]EAY17679.1 hypothetical protein TVAG_169910 [Trichomonas vaginalis G3]KAI5507917.1 hypothetical protein TVAGG3_0681050 [Trichomonas vaginalis G3]|eukprot:XP_001329814.1 hypothetical protein [Trichomonas vaginalis G3]
MLELEFARLETKLARQSSTPEKYYTKPHYKPRWSLDDLRNETKYLDNMARKALSPVRFYPSQPVYDIDEDLNSTYPKISEPHRIDPQITLVPVNRGNDYTYQRNTIQPEIPPSLPVNLMNEADPSLGLRPKPKKHEHRHREPIYKFRKSPQKEYPRKTAKQIELGTPPDSLDAALDSFIDNIEEVGKWAD